MPAACVYSLFQHRAVSQCDGVSVKVDFAVVRQARNRAVAGQRAADAVAVLPQAVSESSIAAATKMEMIFFMVQILLIFLR